METLTGQLERVVFENPDSGWCVLKLRVKGRRHMVTVVGHCFFPSPGETFEAEGEWTEHSQYGERFMATTLKSLLPATAGAAEKYLGSGLMPGVGPGLASRLVARFGADVFRVIEEAPDLMRDVPGIGPGRAAAIEKAWREQKAARGLMAFLNAHGLSAMKAPRILRAFGPDALEIIERNPYRLSREVEGLGFKSADRIARHLAHEPDAEERLSAALHDRLMHAMARGHCAYPAEFLVRETASEAEVSRDDVAHALETEIESGRFTEDLLDGTPCVFRSAIYAAEQRLAQSLLALGRAGRPALARVLTHPYSKIRSVLESARDERFPVLSEKQRAALEKILASKLAVLTGGPGTGKTTLIRAIHESYFRRGLRVQCCAPTGRASQRLAAVGVEARTIHRLLGWDSAAGGFRYRAELKLPLDLLIVDEASMVGLELMDALAQALPQEASLVLVGDIDQLPSVQAGRVLESIVESGAFTHVHLTEVFRQISGHTSTIIRAAQAVIAGQWPLFEDESDSRDFHFIEAKTPSSCLELVEKLVTDRIPARLSLKKEGEGSPILSDSIQVLTPTNKGEVGARSLNQRLQAVLNPAPADKVERFGQSLAIGDKVIMTANDYDKEIFNGDIGRVLQIERERSSLRIDFGGRRIDFSFAELDLLSLAYAVTIHKAQGSEYEAVVIALQDESAPLLGRNLLYTAITRGKRLVVLVGSRGAVRLALKLEARHEKRWSGLERRLRERPRSGSIEL